MLIGLASCALPLGASPPTWATPEGIQIVEVKSYYMAYQEAGIDFQNKITRSVQE
jgi:hypothetical protein